MKCIVSNRKINQRKIGNIREATLLHQEEKGN